MKAKDVKRLRIGVFIFGVVLAASLIIALLIPDDTSCTERACMCSRAGSQGQEIPCNSCGTSDRILVSGVFDIVRVCQSREFVTCPSSPDACMDDGSGLCAPASTEVRPTGDCSLETRWFSMFR